MEKFKKLLHRYFIDALSAMAYGLFASLIIGVIISQIAKIPMLEFLSMYSEILAASSPVIGCSIGCSIGVALNYKRLSTFTLAGVGAIGYKFGGPLGAYISCLIAGEISNLIEGKTPIDIILIPFVALVIGGIAAKIFGAPISRFMTFLGSIINNATYLRPIEMGIVISVLMGIFLTMPISSAAIAISLNLSGIAAGAATVGCCVHMLGFAIMSIKDNKIGGFFAQGLGTSMIQIPNIIKNPMTIIPPIITSAILGPLATTVLQIQNLPYGAGMGTSGLVGVFGVFEAMSNIGESPIMILIKIVVLLFVLPIILNYIICYFLKKHNFIKSGDLKLD